MRRFWLYVGIAIVFIAFLFVLLPNAEIEVHSTENIRVESNVTNGQWKISVTNLGDRGSTFEIKAVFPYASGSSIRTWNVYIESMDTWTTQGFDSKIIGPIAVEVHKL